MNLFKELKCCITGKLLSKNDNIVCFPIFLDEPKTAKEQVEKYLTDPVFQKISDCNEGYALRSAFGRWELHDTVMTKAIDSLIRQAHYPPYRILSYQDDNYLLQTVNTENRVVMYFLHHLLTIDCTQNEWMIFCKKIEDFKDEVSLQGREHLIKFFFKDDDLIIVKRWINVNYENMPYEEVKLSLTEWGNFKSIISLHFLG